MNRREFKVWLGEVMRLARLAQGLTQRELGDATGLTGSGSKLISSIEKGRSPVPPLRAQSFEKALGLPAGFLTEILTVFYLQGGGPLPFRLLEDWRGRFHRELRTRELYDRLLALTRTGVGAAPPAHVRGVAPPIPREAYVTWVPVVRRRPRNGVPPT